jgi:methyl-accepting chemotaxis protein
MSIKQQTQRAVTALIGFVLFAILVAGISVREISLGGPLHSANQLQSDLVADILPPPEYIIEPYLEATVVLKDHMVDEHVARLAQLRKDYETRKQYWQASALDDDLRQQMAVANKSADAFWNDLDARFVPALQGGDFAGAETIHDQSLTALYAAHRTDINKLVDMTVTAQSDLQAHSKWIRIASFAALLLVAGALILSLRSGSRKLRRLVVDPVDETAEEMRRMAAGDFDVHISGLGRDDEIGQMARAMEVFREAGMAKAQAEAKQKRVVTDLGNGLSELAQGNLAHRISQPFSAEYEDLRASYNRTMDDLSDILSRVTTSAANVDTSAPSSRLPRWRKPPLPSIR